MLDAGAPRPVERVAPRGDDYRDAVAGGMYDRGGGVLQNGRGSECGKTEERQEGGRSTLEERAGARRGAEIGRSPAPCRHAPVQSEGVRGIIVIDGCARPLEKCARKKRPAEASQHDQARVITTGG
jgi:hypothetical protein